MKEKNYGAEQSITNKLNGSRKGLVFNLKDVNGTAPDIASNNRAAHQHLLQMMEKRLLLTIYFAQDDAGRLIAKIESTKDARFTYYLNDQSVLALFVYLRTGVILPSSINPEEFKNTELLSSSDVRKEMLKQILEAKIGTTQIYPFFTVDPGTLKAITRFKFGVIHSFMDRDEDIVEFLQSRGY